MKQLLCIIALTFGFYTANAHNPNTASVVISPINGIWLAQFTISQEGASYALSNYYSDIDLRAISEAEYKKLYLEYLKEKFILAVDGKNVPSTSGGIKLGNHQTDIKILLPNFPATYSSVKLILPLFEENKAQNTVVKFVEKNKSFRKVLNKSNHFELRFSNSETEFIENTAPDINYTAYAFSGVFLLVIGMGIYWIRKKR